MAHVRSRHRFWFGWFSPVMVVVLLLLGNVFATAGHVRAEGGPGGLDTALVHEVGSQPAGSELAAIEIKARDASTDALITGACFYANATSKQSGTYGCDGWDGKFDGVTMLFAHESGTYEVGVKNPPPNRYYLRPYPSVAVTLGTTKHLAFRFGPAGGTDLTVKAERADGSTVLGACAAVFEDAGGGVAGRQVSATICDNYDGLSAAEDGLLRLSGVGSNSTNKFVAVPYAPSGYVTPRPKPFTLQPGTEIRLTFQFALALLTPSCSASRTTGRVGTTVDLNCSGFASYQIIGLYWDGKLVSGAERWSGDTGRVSFSYKIPARPGGMHRLQARSNTHAAPRNYFTIISSVSLSPNSGNADTTVRATLRGFAKGEIINIRVQGQSRIRATTMASSTGSASVLFTVPNGSTTDLIIRAEGSAGNVATARFHRSEIVTAEEPAPAIDTTSTPEPSLTPTIPPTETPTEPPVDAGTPALPEPTETAIAPVPEGPAETPSATAPSEDPPAQEVPATPAE